MQPQLNPQQYQQVLKYMQATSEQNFQSCITILRQYNFNLNTAINAKFNTNHLERQERIDRRDGNRRNQQDDDGQVLVRFIQYLQRQAQESSLLWDTYQFCKNFTLGTFRWISQLVTPQVILRKFLRSKFYVLYKDHVRINFHDEKLTNLLLKTKQVSHRCCFLVVSPNQECQSIITLLKKQQITKKILGDFLFVGFVSQSPQLKCIPATNPPQIILLRYNIFKQIQILKRYSGDNQIQSISIENLNQIIQLSRDGHRKDKNVLVKHRNFIRRQYQGMMFIPQEEEEEQIFTQRHHNHTQQIRQQNDQYVRVQQEERKRLQQLRKLQQQQDKLKQHVQQLQQQRKVRKMSIPDEPLTGDIIRFIFRCPDGSSINRNFLANQTLQLIYNWVQTNQQIEFQDNHKRHFEILHSYPPSPLKNDLKDKELKDVFDSNQQKLMIREL